MIPTTSEDVAESQTVTGLGIGIISISLIQIYSEQLTDSCIVTIVDL